MKLLLDQNLSHKLVARLEPKYPGTKHVKDFRAETEDDPVVRRADAAAEVGAGAPKYRKSAR